MTYNLSDSGLFENKDEDLKGVTSFELSSKYYNSLWKSTQLDLQNLVKTEIPTENPIVFEKRSKAIQETSFLYLKYIKTCNKLIIYYENIAQPQKRRYLRSLFEVCIGRVLELKHTLVDLGKSDFQFMDQALLDLSMLPSDMDIKIPEYMKEDVNDKELQHNKNIVEQYIQNLNNKSIHQEVESKEETNHGMLLKVIQSHKRTREKMVYFEEDTNHKDSGNLVEENEFKKTLSLSKTTTECATIIQRAWRRFISRKRLKYMYMKEMQFMNILPLQNPSGKSEAFEKYRRNVIQRNDDEYLCAKQKMLEEMFVYKAPMFSEELEARIRSYIHEYKEIHKKFPSFPTEIEGGSETMLSIPLVPQVEEKEPVEEDKKERKNTKSPKGSKGKKPKKNKNAKGKDSEADEPAGYSLKPSKFVSVILKLLKEYEDTWSAQESADLDMFNEELLQIKVTTEVKKAVRLAVDEKMRDELERLKKALKEGIKKKKKKKKEKKEGMKKKKVKGKKLKEQPEVDLTAERSLDSLVSELVENGIITNYPKIRLDEFWGDCNYYGSAQSILGRFDKDPLPCLGDIKRVVKEYCLFPMLFDVIHSGEAYVKSILFTGPKGSGKRTLIYSICNEIGATLINLSAENLEGKYSGDDGLEMLMHLVSKVSRLVQPTVIYVKDAENYFWKEKPSSCKISEPNRLKTQLPKLIKRIGPTDRILICGSTVIPFNANQTLLSGCYEKIICIPKPDHNCRRLLWRQMIKKFGGKLPSNSDIHVLSNISDGFTAGQIKKTAHKVLSSRRLSIQDKFPLSAMDFKNALAEHVPVYEEEHQAYLTWMEKLPLGSERVAMLEKEREENPVEEDDDEEEAD
ncbi:hypothetical protein JTE90_014592 [Oedothorax gibbosus]|uniref:ATPase AAA-type core domain-containing protein n=1 Tax=Oedothorax gibbosus TaxID=931172 RepID=A0AAV6VAC2_9ARAC|nr:hypothetical protein JTE90_014592 [Oedothorax gibbosus]